MPSNLCTSARLTTGKISKWVAPMRSISSEASIEPSFLWIRLRYGFNMKRVQDGVAAMRGSQVAVLLIHGTEDRGAPLAGSLRLRDANPQHTDLVVIPGADHEWFSPDRPEVIKRVLAWFDTHGTS